MSEDNKKSLYKQSLNLPTTAFSMEAKLVTNEPLRLKKWQEMDLYQKVLDQHAADPLWILHDGPPFANGDIHIGHVINKTLKDCVIRFRTMQGHRVPYVPGWDCHGLPIEHKIQQELGQKMRELPVVEVRQKCYDYAAKYARIQSEQFQRLGVLGDWAHPYWTMESTFEAHTLEVFARFVEDGLVYKKLKPVPWSITNQTALADAELEYKDVQDTSIYVEFPVAQDSAATTRQLFALSEQHDVMFLVWTTTPWTLPANLAIAIHPEVDYVAVTYLRDGMTRVGIMADALKEKVLADAQILAVSAPVKGVAMFEARLGYNHPFISRTGLILTALYVTTEDGTGLVHTAPGHGEDDYLTGMAHKLPVYCPVLHNGTFDKTAPEWLQGINVFKANPLVVERLKADKLLLKEAKITHSYPHDWRSKTPIIFRATEQWFIAVDKPFALQSEMPAGLRDRALAATKHTIEFIPAWGQARMNGMLQSRPDWCVSRQRAWGLPIPVFYNQQGEVLLTPQTVRAVAKCFAEKSSEAWFTLTPEQLLEGVDTGANFPKDQLRKESDIFDCWFESGSSWHDVLQHRAGHQFPADLYLEGSDQHRGWFQLSLLPSLGYKGVPPYKQVLTHGFIVKPDGTKVSKSDKEYVKAVDEINRHGADLLRLWCCSVDYQGDIPTSPKVIQEFADKYRKIRNTLRYLLSNLYDFNPATDTQPIPPRSLDAWALDQLDTLIKDTTDAYDGYQTHKAFRLLHDFCAVQLSAVYGNAMKDRLYCEQPNSPIRRRCQTVMHQLVTALIKLLAPMIVFTADEAWEHVVHKPKGEENLPSVHLTALPKPAGRVVPDDIRQEWKTLFELRDSALLQLDALKKAAGMNKALDAEIIYHIPDARLLANLQLYGVDLEDIVSAGFHTLSSGDSLKVELLDRRETYPACARSWKRRPDVGSDPDYPELCPRDAAAIKAHAK